MIRSFHYQVAILAFLSIYTIVVCISVGPKQQSTTDSSSPNVATNVTLPLESSDHTQQRRNTTKESRRIGPFQKNESYNVVESSANSSGRAAAPQPTSIVVPLTGELGNHLSRIAHGFALQLAAREFGIETELVFDSTYSPSASVTLKECFPNLRNINFQAVTFKKRRRRELQQEKLFGRRLHESLGLTRLGEIDIQQAFQNLSDVLHQPDRPGKDAGVITLPFLLLNEDVAEPDSLSDKYYNDYRRILQFDYKSCCKLKPDPNETVLHFRNYQTEMNKSVAEDRGYFELDPFMTAYELLGHVRAGEKVAITSRYSSHPSVQPYVDTLTKRGIDARVITGQKGVEDFCFLMHTKKELIGVAESTFALWAAYLGNASRVLLYSIDSDSRRRSDLGKRRVFVHYNWTNPSLQRKIFYRLFNVDSNRDGSVTG